MVSPEAERNLRRITAISFIPAFPMLLAGAIITSGVNIGMGILPLVWSSISGIFHLSHYGSDKSSRNPAVTGCIDAFIGCTYLAILIPFWCLEPNRLWRHTNHMMLETYGSTFLMLNSGIHFFIVLNRLFAAVWSGSFSLFSRECPECARNAGHGSPQVTQRTRDGAHYSLLGDVEEGYRDSIDEETAEAPQEPKGRPTSQSGDHEATTSQV